jgi:hypothetical protein
MSSEQLVRHYGGQKYPLPLTESERAERLERARRVDLLLYRIFFGERQARTAGVRLKAHGRRSASTVGSVQRPAGSTAAGARLVAHEVAEQR